MPIDPGDKVVPRDRIPANPSPTNISTSLTAARATLQIGGAARPDVDALMLEWVVEERINTPARFELVVQNWGTVGGAPGLRFDDRSLLEFGKTIELRAGSALLFGGVIYSLGAEFPGDGPPRARLLAADRLQRLAASQRSRSFSDASDSDVFARIAGDHGMQADIDLSGPTRKLIAQLDCNDLDLELLKEVLNELRQN